MLYDDPVENIYDFKRKVRKLFEEWQELDESYDKDVMICRLHTVLKDMKFSLNIDNLDDEIEMVEDEYKIVQMKYELDTTEDVEYDDVNLTF